MGKSKLTRLSLLAGLLFVLSASSAYASGVFVHACDTCITLEDFKAAAGAAAVSRGTLGGGDRGLGTYLMSNSISPRTAIVKVSGYRYQTCGSNGECRYRLMVTNTQVVDPSGAPVTTEAGLERTDEAYFTSRGKPLPPVSISATYSGSIIGSIDQEVGPGISSALTARLISVGNIKINSIVLVTFPDGTKATFIKQCNCSDMWKWTGQAWDKDGKPIRRDGSRISPSAPTGASSGGSLGGMASGGGIAWQFWMQAEESCQANITITDMGTGLAHTYLVKVPC